MPGGLVVDTKLVCACRQLGVRFREQVAWEAHLLRKCVAKQREYLSFVMPHAGFYVAAT